MKQAIDASQRVDIRALMHALPVSALEPNTLACLGGFRKIPKDDWIWKERINLLESPAGQRVPYIEPVAALEILLHHHGLTAEEAKPSPLNPKNRM